MVGLCLRRNLALRPPDRYFHLRLTPVVGTGRADRTRDLGRLFRRLRYHTGRALDYFRVAEWRHGRPHFHVIVALGPARPTRVARRPRKLRSRLVGAALAAIRPGGYRHSLTPARNPVGLARYVLKDDWRHRRAWEPPPAGPAGRFAYGSPGFFVRPLKALWKEIAAERVAPPGPPPAAVRGAAPNQVEDVRCELTPGAAGARPTRPAERLGRPHDPGDVMAMTESTLQPLPLADIVADEGIQPRAQLDPEAVADYAARLRAGEDLPPPVAFRVGPEYLLADGFHRLAAARAAGLLFLPCDVRPGTRRDAVLFAAGANARHGVRMTNADKRRAVSNLLADPDLAALPDREIARHVGVTHPFVARLRQARAGGNGYHPPEPADPDDDCPACVAAAEAFTPVWHCACGAHPALAREACPGCGAPRPEESPDFVVVGGRLYPTPLGRHLPDLQGAAFEAFVANVRAMGIVVPVTLDTDGGVADGRQRLRAARAAGVKPPFSPDRVPAGLEALYLSFRRNVARRHYSPAERRAIKDALDRLKTDLS
jgi:ParB-like chromosome segregation protein Spo0J